MQEEIILSILTEIKNDYRWRLGKMRDRNAKAVLQDKITAIDSARVIIEDWQRIKDAQSPTVTFS